MSNRNVRALAVDPLSPTTLYAGTAFGGVFRTTDGGAHWTPTALVLGTSSIMALAVARTDPGILYAGTTGGLIKSPDQGLHWEPIVDEQINLTITALAVDPKDPSVLYVGTGGLPFKSADSGKSWTKLVQWVIHPDLPFSKVSGGEQSPKEYP